MKNWTVADAVATINAGKDVVGIKEITTHFPEFALAVAKNDLAAVASMMPEKMTLRRLQLAAVEAESEEDDGDEVEAPKTSGKRKVAEPVDDEGYSGMTKEQLIDLCVKKGLKVVKHQKPKQYYIDALNEAGDDEDEEEETPKKSGKVSGKKVDAEDDDEYAGKSAKDLFNMCKERGIKVQPRHASRVYVEALKAADAADAEDDGEDEDWGDDDVAEEAPNKQAKTSGKGSKKAAKKEEDDDGEDWEI